MEIFEILFALAQGCECFLALMSIGAGTGGAVEAVRGKPNREERRRAKETGEKPPPLSLDNWFAIGLFALMGAAVLILILALVAAQQ